MPIHKCNLCGKIFGLKSDLKRHIAKKNPCIYIDNIEKNIDEFAIKNIKLEEPEDILYNTELNRLQDDLKSELYLYVFNALETNVKFKKFYEDTVSKLFLKLFSLCQRKIASKEEYKRDWELFEDNKIKSNDLVKNKLIEIFKENEIYFNKRLLKYARNVAIEIYDIKYIDLTE
jgi:hypothetical protein